MSLGAWVRAITGFWTARSRGVRIFAVVLAMAAVWWSSSQEGQLLGSGGVASFVHNSGHIVAFGAIAGLVLCALAEPTQWVPLHAWIAIAVAGCYGMVDELHQSYVPGRSCTVSDGISDVVGAMLMMAILFGIVRGDARARRWILPALGLAVGAVAFATWGPW